MKKNVQSALTHPLVKGSTTLLSGSFFANIFNFIFSWYMIGALKEQYAVLATLVSVITLPTLMANAISPLIVKYAASYFAMKQLDKAHGLYVAVTKFQFILAIVVFLCLVLVSKTIGTFFHITDYFLLILADIGILISFLSVINISFLQAKLSFGYLTFLNALTSGSKLALGILFVSLGFSSGGAFAGISLSLLLAFLASFIPLSFLLKKGGVTKKFDTAHIFYYGFPSALAVLGLSMFINSDIMLVQHFFSASDSSFYAAISLPAKVIYYLTAPVSLVMFPLIVQKKSKKENYTNSFLLSLLFVLLPSILIVLFEFLFPRFVLQMFQIPQTTAYDSGIIGRFGFFITIFSLLSIVINFYLAIDRTRIFIPILLFSCSQIIAIWFSHSSLTDVISISSAFSLVLLIILLLYYPYATKKK